jgi:protein TonB
MSSKERRDDSFIKKPVYPGGSTAFRKFIKENLKYPKEALTNKIEGTIFIKYTVDHKGKVIETKVVKGIGYGCDEEAQRILKLLQFEIPKNPRKLRVTFHQNTQITFKLPKKQSNVPSKTPPPQPSSIKMSVSGTAMGPMQLRYFYTPTKKKAKPKQPAAQKQKMGYTITLT